MISIYPQSRDKVNNTKYLPVNADTFKEVASYALRSMWSPIIFRNNYRCQANFIQAEYCALDIDEGLSLDECCKILQGYKIKSVILSTENHQKLKKGKICDRLRIIMKWDAVITDPDVYTYNYGIWNKTFKGDTSTVESGRHFKASAKFLAAFDGELLKVMRRPPKPSFNKWAEIEKLDYLEKKKIPQQVDDFIKSGALIGSGRQDSFFKAACILRNIGLPKHETVQLLRRAPIEITDFDYEREFNHAVNSAYRYT